MQDPIPVTEFEPSECHSEPTFNIGREKNNGSIFDNKFEICVQKFKHQVQVGLGREDVEELNNANEE